MKKIIPILILATTAVGALTACNSTNGSQGDSSNQSDYEFNVIFDEIENERIFEKEKCEIGAVLSGIYVKQAIDTGVPYEIDISLKGIVSKELDITFSHNDVIKYEYNETTQKYYFIGLKPGNSIFSIRNANEELIYRDVVHVRDIIEEDMINDYLLFVDKFHSSEKMSQFDKYDMLFLPGYRGIVNATEEGQTFSANFTYEFNLFSDLNNFYYFTITTFEENPTGLKPIEFGIHRNGSIMILFDKVQPIDMFYPIFSE